MMTFNSFGLFKGPEKAFASNTLFLLYVYDTDHANAYAYTQKKTIGSI